jgi:hypothetical protein
MKQLKLQLYTSLKPGDVVIVTGFDQLGYRNWKQELGVLDCFPEFCKCHLSVWLVGYFFNTDIPLILPFTKSEEASPSYGGVSLTPDQLQRTGRKHRTTWQYKTTTRRNKARLKVENQQKLPPAMKNSTE